MSGDKGWREGCAELPQSLEELPRSLIPALQRIQERFGYLPREALEEAARSLGVPVSRVYGVATFYAQFSLVPKGKHSVKVCLGTACHVRGAPQVLEELKRQLQIKGGGISPDGLVSLEEVRCVGACALGPVVIADGEYWGRMTPGGVKELVRTLRGREDAKA